VVRCGQVKGEGLPQLSPQAALGFDLYFDCSEVDITHTPNLVKIFSFIFSAAKVWHVGLGRLWVLAARMGIGPYDDHKIEFRSSSG
jgi:hypothetical protein